MSGSRSKNGCWTCRLRRKKCDETHPVCRACAFRNATCHGYGPQPYWMDGGELEETELVKIKEVVRQSYRARRRLRTDQPSSSIAGCEMDNLEHPSDKNDKQEGDWQPQAGTSELVHHGTHNNPKRILGHPISFRGDLSSDSNIWLPELRDISYNQELGKVSYFFDHVFPIQHPFYRSSPSVPNKEQQWLQEMLRKTSHYRLSALAISTLHQNISVDNENAERGKGSMLELLEYHSLSVNALQGQLSNLFKLASSLQRNAALGLLASMIQLVSFEVIRESKPFKDDIGNWEIHLGGAEALLDMMYSSSNISVHGKGLDPPMTSSRNLSAWNPNISPVAGDLQPLEIIGFNFLTALYMWADICRCASMGWHYRIDQVYPYKQYIDEDRVHLSSVMGCSNWAMGCIMDISQLEAWRNEGIFNGSYEVVEGYHRGAILQKRLIEALKQQWPILSSVTLEERDKILITCAYGICALIYLHIVILDAGPGNHMIQDYVERAITMMKAISPHRLRCVSWPFCVAGCMATRKKRNAFRQIFKLACDTTTSSGTIWSGFAVVEECWKQRSISKDWCKKGAICWRQAMDSLGVRILLI